MGAAPPSACRPRPPWSSKALRQASYANGIFALRRIERATFRDVAVRFVAANLHTDHDTIASFRRVNKIAFEAVFLQVLLPAREVGLLRLGTVSIDGTKIDANASKIRSVRYDRAKQLRAKLAADIAALTKPTLAARLMGARRLPMMTMNSSMPRHGNCA